MTGGKAKQGFYRREKDGTILCYDKSLEARQFGDLEERIQVFQAALMGLKYSSIPVVAAPFI